MALELEREKLYLVVVDFVGRIFVAFFASDLASDGFSLFLVGVCIVTDSLFPAGEQALAPAIRRETLAGPVLPNSESSLQHN